MLQRDGQQEYVDLTENDLVFITPGGCVENSTMGTQNSPAAYPIPRSEPRRRLGYVAADRSAGPCFRPAGQVLL